MTFTYDLTTPDNITDVRFEIRDTVEATALFSDEEITYAVSKKGSVNLAVIALIRAKIGELSNEDDFKADWLQVDSSKRLAGLKALLSEKLNEYGLTSGTAGVVQRYRPDSAQHDTPDYGAPDYDYGSGGNNYD